MVSGGYPFFKLTIIYFSHSLFACMSLQVSRALCVRAYALCCAFLGSYTPCVLFLLISREIDPWFLPRAFAISRPLYFLLRSIAISFLSLLLKRENFFCFHKFNHTVMQYKTEIQKAFRGSFYCTFTIFLNFSNRLMTWKNHCSCCSLPLWQPSKFLQIHPKCPRRFSPTLTHNFQTNPQLCRSSLL